MKHKVSKSERAGLQFPVSRVRRLLIKSKQYDRISSGASVYFTAVLEYLAAELLDISANAAEQNHKKRITPQHIQQAIKSDEDFCKLLLSITIPSSTPVVRPYKARSVQKVIPPVLTSQYINVHKRPIHYTADGRPICWYDEDEKCYRKNPDHFLHFAHPKKDAGVY